MTNTIMDSGNVAEILDLGPDDEISNMSATKEPTGTGIEFHVAMHGHTFHDMEELIVQAAAQQIVGRHGERELVKLIEARCIALTTAKADVALEKITSEIIDQPITPKYGDKQPLTMREFIGLTGREYLSEPVEAHNGATVKRDGYRSSDHPSRMQYLVSKYMDMKFKREVEKATNDAIASVRAAIEANHKALLDAEKRRFAEALAKLSD